MKIHHLATIPLVLLSLAAAAQSPVGKVIFEGSDPPVIIHSNVDVSILRTGIGRYTLEFSNDIDGVNGSSFTSGPGGDAPATVPIFTLDTTNRRRLYVLIRGLAVGQLTQSTDAAVMLDIWFEDTVYTDRFEQ